ncbi:hypothetical protein EJB05_00725, partial [Eragrostis curvula]
MGIYADELLEPLEERGTQRPWVFDLEELGRGIRLRLQRLFRSAYGDRVVLAVKRLNHRSLQVQDSSDFGSMGRDSNAGYQSADMLDDEGTSAIQCIQPWKRRARRHQELLHCRGSKMDAIVYFYTDSIPGGASLSTAFAIKIQSNDMQQSREMQANRVARAFIRFRAT